MHISILTATGCGNLGDEMILSQEYIHLKNTYPDAIFHIFTYDTIGTQEILDTVSPSVCAPEYVHYFPHYIRRRPFQNIYYFFKNIYTLAISDLVVCGGGGIFYEDGTHSGWRKRIWQWYMRAYIAGICGARIYWWSISLETADDTHIQSLKRIFSIRNTTVTVRDTRSKELLQKISITADVVPDMAMMTQGTYDQSLDAISHSNPQSKYVGISLRSGHIYDTHIHTLLDYIQGFGYTPIFLSFSLHTDTPENDMEYVRAIAIIRNIHITKTLSETLAYIPKMDMILAMRLHGSILAFAYHVPFITLSYGYKTAEFCKSIDYPYILDTKNIDIKELTDMISVVISQADTLRTDIAREHIQVQQHIHTKLLVHNI